MSNRDKMIALRLFGCIFFISKQNFSWCMWPPVDISQGEHLCVGRLDCNLLPGVKFVRPAADTDSDSLRLQDSDFQLFLSFVGIFVVLPPSLSPRCFCPILTARFFIALLLLPSSTSLLYPLIPGVLSVQQRLTLWRKCMYRISGNGFLKCRTT